VITETKLFIHIEFDGIALEIHAVSL